MANPHKGEVAFEAGEQTRTLRFDTNAICIAEEDLDLGVDQIISRLNSGRLSVVRVLYRAGLVGNVTLPQAGEIIDELGHARAMELLSEALALAFPKADDSGPPPKGEKVGTGKRSS